MTQTGIVAPPATKRAPTPTVPLAARASCSASDSE